MNINTKTELKGSRYRCLRIIKGASIEDIPAMRKNITKQVAEQGGKVTEIKTAWNFGNQFITKPKQPREKIGVLDCTGSYATFDGVRIEYKNMQNVFAACFETENAKFAIHAKI